MNGYPILTRYPKSVSMTNCLRYQVFPRSLVFGKEIDDFVRSEIVREILPLFVFMPFPRIVFVAMMFLITQDIDANFVGLWVILECLTLTVVLVTYRILFDMQRRGDLSLLRFYCISMPAILISSITAGLMASSIGAQNDDYYYLAIVVLSATMFGGCIWLGQIIHLSALFSIIGLTLTFFEISANGTLPIVWGMIFIFYFWILVGVSMLWTNNKIKSYVSVFRARKQADIIKEIYREFQLNASDWVWETNSQKLVTHTSSDSVSALDPSGIFGTSFLDFFEESDPNTKTLGGYLEQNRSFSNLTVHKTDRTNDVVRYWELRGNPKYDENGKVDGFRGFARDISTLVELNRLSSDAEKSEIVSKIIAKVSHDLNNSLTVIYSSTEYLQILLDDSLTEEQRAIILSVLDTVQATSKVNNQMLAFTLKEVLRPERSNLNSLLEQAAQRSRLVRKDLVIETDFDRDVIVFIDLIAFNRSIDNILRNSLDETPDNGAITIKTQFRDEGRGGLVTITFSDTGPGFSHQALKKAGDPFFTTKRETGGSGLGLSATAGFLQQSGGQFKWGNGAHGAVVEMTLPANLGVNNEQNIEDDTVIDLGGKTMLLVDDDLNILRALELRLTHAGLQVSVASSFEEALEVAGSLEHGVDLLLSDINLSDSGPNGIALAKYLDGFYRTAIFMTGYSELIGQIPTSEILPKPFSLEDLRRALLRKSVD